MFIQYAIGDVIVCAVLLVAMCMCIWYNDTHRNIKGVRRFLKQTNRHVK